MTEIGNTLREARMRQQIEIREVEDATKIRMKYLRALEAEDFDTLPAPAYAKSFLRSYANFLGLDANLLVEQYRAEYDPDEQYEYERPTFVEEPAGGGVERRRGAKHDRSRRSGRGPRISRGWVIALLVVGLIVFLLILGLTGGNGGSS